MNTTQNKKLMADILAHLAQGKSDLLVESMAESVSWTTPGVGKWAKTYAGKDAVVNGLFRNLMSRLVPPYKAALVRLLADGDLVAVELRGTGNRTKSGETYDNHYCWICTFEDARLTAVTEFCDTELSTARLGSF